MSFTGVDQTTPLGTYASSSGTAATQSVAISSAANELAFAVAGAQTQLLTNSGNTEYWNDSARCTAPLPPAGPRPARPASR